MNPAALLTALVIGVVALAAPAVFAQPAAAETAAKAPKEPAKSKSKAKSEAPIEGQYTAEADAKQKCGAELVVWVNSSTKVYHFAGNRSYGKTSRGAYMCRNQADKTGFHAAKNEKAPGAK
jgi:hypothetical protein